MKMSKIKHSKFFYSTYYARAYFIEKYFYIKILCQIKKPMNVLIIYIWLGEVFII